MLYQSTRKRANALSLFTIIYRTNTYKTMKIVKTVPHARHFGRNLGLPNTKSNTFGLWFWTILFTKSS